MGKKQTRKKRRLSASGSAKANEHHQSKTSKLIDEDDIVILGDDIVVIEDSDPVKPSTSLANVEKIEGLLRTQNFVIIQGPFGCGKTYTTKILSERRSTPLHLLQINDQYDSKVLFGSYECTELPGEFIWRPSKFAECLQQRCLIALENIDHGGSDLASAIISLVENGHCDLPNGQNVQIHPDCRILGTIATDERNSGSSHIPIQLCEYAYRVRLPELKADDLKAIITKTMLRLAPIVDKLITTFFVVSNLIRQEKNSVDRLLNSNDLFRAAKRLNSLKDMRDGRAVFVELLDVWAMHLTGTGLRQRVAAKIGEALSLSEDEQNFFMDVHQPEIKADNENHIQFGRASLERRLQEISPSSASTFVITRDSSLLLERLANCVAQSPPEPVLLAGETGVGKTAVVQHLAKLLRVPLRVVNLSQESEFTDLIGGYKPTSPTEILRPLAEEYLILFKESFDADRNAKFLDNLNKCFNAQRFGDFLQLVVKSSLRAHRKFPDRQQWAELVQRARRLAKCFGQGDQWRRRLLFSYMKGVVAEAAEHGHWLLVDEINLASAECLDALIELLEPSASVHPQFRLFACMNHATDVGKRCLPNAIRFKFTEFFVWETTDPEQLHALIKGQLPSLGNELIVPTLHFYTEMCKKFPGKFSLRTLSRALSIAKDQPFSCQRSCLIHGCKISFSSQLTFVQRDQMLKSMEKHFGKFPPSTALNPSQIDSSKFVLVEGGKIARGAELIRGQEGEEDNSFIFTPHVRANMALLASVVSTGKFPVLMEGETSAGKTSMIIQLAKMSGNRVYRINNHEHTDIQEYIGTYAPDAQGRLQFVEGVLLKAVRNGDWVILDELNLAPSSVLEALNRLLDDNRELFVPELNRTVHAHPNFQLFATQNPVGTYAGRKRLSRAFLSRFMVLQCDSLPLDELPQIVHRRCGVAPTQAQMMVKVLEELKARRAISGIFASSDSLMTLRDLFRWANRVASLEVDTDWRQSLADQGYFVLAVRCRNRKDEGAVVEVLEKELNRRVDICRLFGPQSPYLPELQIPSNIVPTAQLRRMLILCSEAWKCKEPVLLVGETGCGKTTAVHLFGSSLLSINCHEKTDAADLLGSIRPVAGTFRWQDGVVLQAMREGKRLLLDEISLASDSVLERLNSLLEPQRTLLLTDAGGADQSDMLGHVLVTAAPDFQLVATMNPGNDHGKKELSKALRNRFTEVWCPQEHDREDLLQIVRQRLLGNDGNGSGDKLTTELVEKVAQLLVAFSQFFSSQFNEILRFNPSTRDLVALAELFVKFYANSELHVVDAIYHSIEANFLDALGVLPSRIAFDRRKLIGLCREQLKTLITQFELDHGIDDSPDFGTATTISLNRNSLSIGPFNIHTPEGIAPKLPTGFSLNAPTIRKNAQRVARALYSSKPVMLEGSPGAGKSSLVMALAAATGHKLVRLNLSEQTDLYDLFGSDIPLSSAEGTSTTFAWRDGPVLKAMKEGSWILLDEMNLASQSVLEGLNSCFDFRRNIYISELDKTFHVELDKCRFFACQNPHTQGGSRRALPKSFLNRFVSIFMEEMTDADFIFILCEFCEVYNADINSDDGTIPLFGPELISKLVLVNKLCRERIQQNSGLALQNGGPFEFNLRDLFRWVEAIRKFGGNVSFGFDLVYLSRLKNQAFREKVISEIFDPVFEDQKWMPSLPLVRLQTAADPPLLSIGNVNIQMGSAECHAIIDSQQQKTTFLMATQLELLEKMAACVSAANWLVLLVGPSHVGKRSAIKTLATLMGKRLMRMRLTTGTDALDLLGSFEQVEVKRPVDQMELEEDETEDGILPAPVEEGSNLRFEWMDSLFLRAFRDGHWLLLEDVNCCNSAVLDCLNSCLENEEGELILPTAEAQAVRRHPNFRVFFTMDPQNGQLSRAMRNRAVEIQFCAADQSLNGRQRQQLWSQDIFDFLTTTLFDNNFNPTKANQHRKKSAKMTAHLQLLQNALCKHSTQTLLNCAALMRSQIEGGSPFDSEHSFQQALDLLMKLLDEENEQQNPALPTSDANSSSSLALNAYGFPPLTRLRVPTRIAGFDGQLLSYYWRCWDELTTSNFPSTPILQLALVFPAKQALDDRNSLILLGTTITDIDLSEKRSHLNQIDHLFYAGRLSSAIDDRNAAVDELLESSFRAMQAIGPGWREMSKKASNETPAGQQYISALQMHAGNCQSCRTREQLEQCGQKWRAEQKLLAGTDQPIKNSTFGPLQMHLTKMLQLLSLSLAKSSDGHNNNDACSLLWKCPEDGGHLFTFSRVMSTYLPNVALDIDTQSPTLSSYLHTPFLALATSQLLWTRLQFSDNILRQIRVGELTGAREQLESTLELLWDLAFARKAIHRNIKKNMSFCKQKFSSSSHFTSTADNNNIEEQFGGSSIISAILSLIQLLTPPEAFLDPPFYAHKKHSYLKARREHLDIYFSALREFLQLTVAKQYDLDQLALICSHMNSSPFMQSLAQARDTTLVAASELLEEAGNYLTAYWNEDGGDQRRIYRAIWAQEEEAEYVQNFRRLVVEQLRNSTRQLTEFLTGSANNIFSDDNAKWLENPERVCAQLLNSIQTVDMLKTRICSLSADRSSLPPAILIYPEMLMPYSFLLNCLAIVLAEMHSKAQRMMQQKGMKQPLSNLLSILKNASSPVVGHAAEDAIDQLLHWTLEGGENEQLQPQHKLQIFLWAFPAEPTATPEQRRKSILRWLFQEWAHWHEENAQQKKAQLFVMKAAKSKDLGNGEEQNTEQADDEDGIGAYLPDFSNTNFEEEEEDQAIVMEEETPAHLTGEQLHAAFQSLFNPPLSERGGRQPPSSKSTAGDLPILSLLRVLDQLDFRNCHSLLEDDSVDLMDLNLTFHHLSELSNLRNSLQFDAANKNVRKMRSSTTKALNVYRDSDPSALVQCLDILALLQHRSLELLAEFPENAQLLQLTQSIDAFVHKAPAGAPLMKQAAQLERILVHAEEWETIADRAHSIRAQLVPMQELLVEWRRREVQCWAELVTLVQEDISQLAVLVSWPLFKCALDTVQDGSDGRTLLLMFLDWMHSATLADFRARLWTGRLLAQTIALLDSQESHQQMDSADADRPPKLSARIRSVVAHFDQFSATVSSKFDQQFAPIKAELAEFTRVVRYTDLNLWSVRDSAKKAHTQLFRILRKFKEICNEPLSPLLLDKLPSMPESAVAPTGSLADPASKSKLDSSDELAQMLCTFGLRFERQTNQLMNYNALEDLKQNAAELLKLIQTEIVYNENATNSAPNGDKKEPDEVEKANEKLQGRALFERQQCFARLVKSAARFGLAARRAHKLDSEALTVQVLSEFPSQQQHMLCASAQKVSQLFHHVVAGRNVFLRQFASIRRQQQPHLVDQLSVANLDHLRGLTEFGLHWLFFAITGLAKRATQEECNLKMVAECFEVELENGKNCDEQQQTLFHQQMNTIFASCCANAEQMSHIVERMKRLLECCPRQQTKQHSLSTATASFPLEQHCLGPLRQGSAEHAELVAELNQIEERIKQLMGLNADERLNCLQLPFDGTTIWRRKRWATYQSTFAELLERICISLIDSKSTKHYFPEESERLLALVTELQQQISVDRIAEETPFSATPPFDQVQNAILLRLQSVYKEVELLLNNEAALNSLDAVQSLIGLAGRICPNQIVQQLLQLFHSTASCSTEFIEKCTVLARGLSTIFGHLLRRLSEFLCQLAAFQAHWVAIGCHLLAKGFVNPIPKAEPAHGKDQKAAGDGCGFGDGDLAADATDVSTQVESMEQIEGLEQQQDGGQNELQTEEEGKAAGDDQAKLPDVEQPIDVDDDFAGCLEGLDADEGDEQEQDGIDEHNEQPEDDRADWNFGDVDEQEETQLDPKLWEPESEEEEQQPQREMEEGDKEVEKEMTGELTSAQQQSQKLDGNEEQKAADERENGETQEMTSPLEGAEEETPTDDQAQPMDSDEQQGTEKENREAAELGEQEEGQMEEDVDDDDIEMQENGEEEEMGASQNDGTELLDGGDQQPPQEPDLDETHEEPPKEAETLHDSTAGQQQQQIEPEAIGQKQQQQSAPNASQQASESEGDEKSGQQQQEAMGRGQGAGDGSEHRDKQQQSVPTSDKKANNSEEDGKKNREREEEEEAAKEEERERNPCTTGNPNNESGLEEEGLEEDDDELESTDQQELAAHASSTVEQARRTRKLFNANLRRLMRKSARQLAEELPAEKESSSGGENGRENAEDNHTEEVERVPQTNSAGGQTDNESGMEAPNIFMDHNQAHYLDPDSASVDQLAIQKLCSEFDRLEQQQSTGGQERSIDEQRELQLKWALITDSIAPLAAELTESLRTILEPTIANRLQGDYRTGKRLNMRRLIGYIASDYRKDRIWMRRTRRAKRNYQICIAVDNSQSMQHNHMTEITCNVLCLIERALRQLEVGQLAVCSFGSQVRLLSDFSSSENTNLGFQLLGDLKFDQQRTDLAELLASAGALFKSGRERSSNSLVEQMLVVLGDGRGVLTEGVEKIQRELGQLSSQHVTVLFLVMDTAERSITEMRVADFSGGVCTFHPYMQSFPFQLYALVKNALSLPASVAEAVRQWFEFNVRTRSA